MALGPNGLPPQSDAIRRAAGWLRQLSTQGTLVGAACAGTFILGESGLLDGRRCTTTWWLHNVFKPDISYMVASHLQANCSWREGWLRTYTWTRSRDLPGGRCPLDFRARFRLDTSLSGGRLPCGPINFFFNQAPADSPPAAFRLELCIRLGDWRSKREDHSQDLEGFGVRIEISEN
ncbi:DJ-1/PfpI family protein [Paraburkholderia tropica]|uniref:DJ-1/PfpI family protein n=1 Tax=Paraburkholderia tropica TaxID=92647 RepID=UPI001C843075